MSRSNYRASGVILISVLWLLVLLSGLAFSLSYSSRLANQNISHIVAGRQGLYLAEGAVQMVIASLLQEDEMDRPLGDAEELEIDLPGGSASVTLVDENGKVDINHASGILLSNLFKVFLVEDAEADALADAIIDYRDTDDLRSLNGAESVEYEQAGLPWGAKNALFASVFELKKVLGMRPEIFDAVLPYITVYSEQSGVNPEVAALPVLMAISDETVSSLESYIEDRRQSYLMRLPMPPRPMMKGGLSNQARGQTYSILVTVTSEQGAQSSLASVIRLKNTHRDVVIEVLDRQPFASGRFMDSSR